MPSPRHEQTREGILINCSSGAPITFWEMLTKQLRTSHPISATAPNASTLSHPLYCPHLSYIPRDYPTPSNHIIPPLPKRIHQPPTQNIHHTQPHRRAPHQPPRAKLIRQPLPPASRQHQVRGRPGGGQAGGVGGETLQVEVGAEEEDGGKEHGEGLEGAGVLGED